MNRENAYLLPRLAKKVRTSLDFYPNFDGDLVEVSLSGPGVVPKYFVVSVHGQDDTTIGRCFEDFDTALEVYNSITCVESDKDIEMLNDPGICNGWPGSRSGGGGFEPRIWERSYWEL